MIPLLTSAYRLLISIGNSLQSPFLLLIRLYWGWQFFLTGKGKLMNFEKTTDFFSSLNIPLPAFNAALAGSTEMVGGLLLLVGLASRLTAIPLIITMVVAYLTADLDAAKMIFSEPDKFFAAAPFLHLFACVLVLIFGPGKFSIDYLLSKKYAPEKS